MSDAEPTEPPEKPRPRRPRRRLAIRAAILSAGLLVLAIVAVFVVLRLPSGRQAVLSWASGLVESAAGIRFTADDFAIRWRRAAIEAENVELAATGEKPFLTAPRVRAELRLASLLSRRITIRTAGVEGPRFDLGAPMPQSSRDESSEPSKWTFEILRFTVTGGAVDSPPEALDEASWLASWGIEGIDLEGSFQPEELTVDLSEATIEAVRRGADGGTERLAFAAAGQLRGPPAGPYDIGSLTAAGEGLDLSASGRVGFGTDAPLAVAFELDADPARWITGQTGPAGQVEARGDLDLRNWTGTAHWRAEEVPAALVEPWLGRATLARMGAAGSHFDLEGDVELEPGKVEELAVDADLAWRRGEVLLGRARADVRGLRTSGEPGTRLAGEIELAGTGWRAELLEPWLGAEALERAGATGTHLDFDARLVLDEDDAGDNAGEAEVLWQRGTDALLRLSADTTGGVFGLGGQLDLGTLVARVDLEGEDLPGETAALFLPADLAESLGIAGTRLDVEAALTVEDPSSPAFSGRAQLVWRDGVRALLDATASMPRGGRGIDLTLAGDVLPSSPGRRHLEAELRAPVWERLADALIAGGRLEIEAPDLAAAVAELRETWPRLIPEIDPRWPVDGSLSLAADLAGTVEKPEIDGQATWRRNGATFTLDAAGAPFALRGRAHLTVADLDLAALREPAGLPELAGRAEATLELSGSPAQWTGSLRLDAAGVETGSGLPSIDALALEAESDGTGLRLTRLSADSGERRLTGHGESVAVWPPPRADLQIEIEHPAAGIDRMLVDARLAEGVLELEAPEIDGGGERGELRATIPLGNLRAVLGEGLESALDALPAAEGPVVLSFSLPRVDAAALLGDLGLEGIPQTAELAASGQLTLDFDDLTGARSAVEIPRLTVVYEGHRLETAAPMRWTLADRRLVGEALRLELDGRELTAAATLDLSSSWQPGDPLTELAVHLDTTVDGTIEADLFNPYLGGAVASGPLSVEIEVSGPLDGLTGRAMIAGPEARIVARSPYFTRLENPEAEIELEGGRAFLTLGKAKLNGGDLELTGVRDSDGELELYADLSDVRYRFDYGLGTSLSADLTLRLPGAPALASERGRLSGRVIIERGVVRRDLNFEREIVNQLLTPTVSSAADPDSPLAAIDLDIDVVTVDGVRITNNLANLRATWSPMVVRGTLGAPLIDGRLDVEPGGFVYVLGQTARLDQATVFLRGFPEVPPELEIDITTSIEDPLVAREGANRFSFQEPPTRTAAELEEQRQQLVAAGVASYYADQLAGRFGQILGGGTHIEIAPLLVFGETDPGARLTVSRDLSSHVAFAISVDLNTENQQIYLLDFHEFHVAPSLGVQVFTNDEHDQGVNLQQSFTWGGEEDESLPRIREVKIEAPQDFDIGGVRAAADLRKGDRFPDGAEFDVEVDVAEQLRRKGYPGAEVEVRTEPHPGHGIVMAVKLEPGPQVTYEFRGDDLPRAARRAVRGLYRTDIFELTAIEDMRLEAKRALRDRGYPEPEVEVTASLVDPADPAGDRLVVIDVRAGERRPIQEIRLRGLPPEVAEEIEAGFEAQGERIDLAAAWETSDRRLLGMLRRLGYPEAAIAGRRLEEGGELLVVEIDSGPRLRILDVRIQGLTTASLAARDSGSADVAQEEQRLLELLPLKAGDPARSDRITRGTLALETDLRGRGYIDARAFAIRDSSPQAEHGIVLTYRIEPGTRYRIEEIRFEGAERTRRGWAERVTDLDKGAPVDPDDVGDARRRLFETGLFRSVVPEIERGPGGDATVVFEILERPRYQFSYGLRWESSEGAGVVIDGVDHNAFGRGVTLGLRALWTEKEVSARAYSAFPKVFGTRATVQFFAERGQSSRTGRLIDRTESTFQVSVPLGETTSTRAYLRYRDTFFMEPGSRTDFSRVQDPIFGWQLLHDTRNDKISATRGLLLSLDVTGANPSFGGDSSFLRFFGKVSTFQPLARWGGRPVTWAQSLRLGWAEAFGNRELTSDERFFAGGELSVRGYGNDSLGPIAESGVFLGGEALAVLNQELRFPIWGRIRGLLFYDIGNVWADSDDPELDFFTAAGLGLRVSTPVGLVRVDVALPLDRRAEDDDVKLYLGLGNVF